MVMCAAPAWADDASPWAAGVPAERQKQANALFDEGNKLFEQLQHAPAKEKYEAALALWDHPLIEFNLAVTLIRLDRPLEAAEALEKALQWGDKPFTPEHYREALDYQSLLKKQVGVVEGVCTQKDVHVLLDGKAWFDCPGTKTERVMAGEHAIVGERKGYLTRSTRVVVVGGQTATGKVELERIESGVKMEYRTKRWKPWAVTATGAAVALAGAAFYVAGRNGIDQFNNDYKTTCGVTGCEPGLTDPAHRTLASERDSAELEGTIGLSAIAVGGAGIVAGVVWVAMNRPHRVLPNVEVVPHAGGATASVGWRF